MRHVQEVRPQSPSATRPQPDPRTKRRRGRRVAIHATRSPRPLGGRAWHASILVCKCFFRLCVATGAPQLRSRSTRRCATRSSAPSSPGPSSPRTSSPSARRQPHAHPRGARPAPRRPLGRGRPAARHLRRPDRPGGLRRAVHPRGARVRRDPPRRRAGRRATTSRALEENLQRPGTGPRQPATSTPGTCSTTPSTATSATSAATRRSGPSAERAKSHLNRLRRLSLAMPDYLPEMVAEHRADRRPRSARHDPDARRGGAAPPPAAWSCARSRAIRERTPRLLRGGLAMASTLTAAQSTDCSSLYGEMVLIRRFERRPSASTRPPGSAATATCPPARRRHGRRRRRAGGRRPAGHRLPLPRLRARPRRLARGGDGRAVRPRATAAPTGAAARCTCSTSRAATTAAGGSSAASCRSRPGWRSRWSARARRRRCSASSATAPSTWAPGTSR